MEVFSVTHAMLHLLRLVAILAPLAEIKAFSFLCSAICVRISAVRRYGALLEHGILEKFYHPLL